MANHAFLIAALLVCCLCVPSAHGQHFVAVLHDSATHEGSVVEYDLNGTATRESALTWQFTWPLVEMTANVLTKEVFIITFPANDKSTLFVMNSSLEFASYIPPTELQYFDLQFAPLQNTFYGIAVASRYSRVLTQFTLPPANGSAPVYTPIAALPYLWYMNASTFDDSTNTYYGLVNNFPYRPNSTTAQKLAVGSFDSATNKTLRMVNLTLDPLSVSVIIQFVAWTEGKLIGLGNCRSGMCFVHINTHTGVYQAVAYQQGVQAGPIFPGKSWSKVYSVGFDPVGQNRVLVEFDAHTNSVEVVTTYAADGRICAAVTHANW